MPHTLQEKNKQDSEDDGIVIVDEEESNKSKEETPLVNEGIRDEIKEETRVVQDVEQGDEDIDEENDLE
jgi:glycerol-3-phosphate cytidylyltransferase-like family protein